MTRRRATTTSEVVDLRSDTVTRPSAAMRQAIATAEVGDDVLDGDPTTERLEAEVAQRLGHEAALFTPSGTQANQIALGLLGRPGDAVAVEAHSHVLLYEEAGGAALWGLQLRTVTTEDGRLTADLVAPALQQSPWHPRTVGVVVENTHNAHGGTVTTPEALAALRALADEEGFRLHLDGARLWNAAAALDRPVADWGRLAHTVMVSFSKGLGCPVGACLVGSAETIARGVALRRRLGGAMRQSGVLAAAALYALEHQLTRLSVDHRRARRFRDGLADLPTATVAVPETNIVMLDLRHEAATAAAERLAARGVRLSVFGPQRLRAVMHLGLTEDDVDRAGAVVAEALQSGGGR